MAKSDEITAAWAEVDVATTALGARVQTLIDDINKTATEGLNGPQTEAVLANLSVLRDNLNGMGHNPSQPVPDFPASSVKMPGPFADDRHAGAPSASASRGPSESATRDAGSRGNRPPE